MQGWVNGSLRSADLALAHFGLKPLPDDPCIKPDDPRVADSKVMERHFSGVWGA